MDEQVKLPRVCNCKSCQKDVEKREKHLNHYFYKQVDEYTKEVARQQILKGAEKYHEPFDPDSWTGDELSLHAMQELRDGQVYVTGMRDRMRKQENIILAKNLKINWLAQDLEKLEQKLDKARELVKELNKISMGGGGIGLVSRLETLLGCEVDGQDS